LIRMILFWQNMGESGKSDGYNTFSNPIGTKNYELP
jgi:hypothetical protein